MTAYKQSLAPDIEKCRVGAARKMLCKKENQRLTLNLAFSMKYRYTLWRECPLASTILAYRVRCMVKMVS